jgi:hypothetical protein
MSIVREHIIFEKFAEEGDPIQDLSIGLYQDFFTKDEMCSWIVEHLPLILGMNEIPKDIIKDHASFINRKYEKQIKEFMDKFLTLNGTTVQTTWRYGIHYILIEKGFKEE